MRGQLGAELPQCAEIRSRGAGQRVGAVADHRVLTQRAQDHRIVRISVAGVGGEQQLLFKPKVQSAVPGPVGEKRRASFGGTRVCCAPELLWSSPVPPDRVGLSGKLSC